MSQQVLLCYIRQSTLNVSTGIIMLYSSIDSKCRKILILVPKFRNIADGRGWTIEKNFAGEIFAVALKIVILMECIFVK